MRNLDAEAQNQPESLYQHGVDLFVRERLIERFKPYVHPAPSRSLEIGSYEGDMTAMLVKEFGKTEVLEGSKELVKKLSQKFEDDVVVHEGYLESFEPKDLYDNIYLIHTLEHLDSPVEGLLRLKDWLKPDGRIFIAVPNAHALSRRIAVEMGVVEYLNAVTPTESKFGHTVTFSLDSLKSVINKANLNIVSYGGVLLKTLANYQFDQALLSGIISNEYLIAADKLSKEFPDLSSSIYAIASKDTNE